MTEKSCGDDDMTPLVIHKFWHPEEEQRLKYLVESNTPLEEIAQVLSRSSDSIIKKTKRLGLQIPLSWQSGRKTSKGAFEALSWIQSLLATAENMKDVDRVRRRVDQALEQFKKTAAEGFQKGL